MRAVRGRCCGGTRGWAVLWPGGVSRESCGGSGLARLRPAPRPPSGAWADGGAAEQSRSPLPAPAAPVSNSSLGGRGEGQRGSGSGGVCRCLRCSAPCCLPTGQRGHGAFSVRGCEPSPAPGPWPRPLPLCPSPAPLQPWGRPPAASSVLAGLRLWRLTPAHPGQAGSPAATRDRPASPSSQGPRSTEQGGSVRPHLIASFSCALRLLQVLSSPCAPFPSKQSQLGRRRPAGVGGLLSPPVSALRTPSHSVCSTSCAPCGRISVFSIL